MNPDQTPAGPTILENAPPTKGRGRKRKVPPEPKKNESPPETDKFPLWRQLLQHPRRLRTMAQICAPSLLSEPIIENTPSVKRKKKKKGTAMWTQRKRRTPQGQSSVVLWKRLQGLIKHTDPSTLKTLVSQHKKKRLKPCKPSVSLQETDELEATSSSCTYPQQNDQFEPPMILNDKLPDQAALSADIKHISFDHESRILSPESCCIQSIDKTPEEISSSMEVDEQEISPNDGCIIETKPCKAQLFCSLTTPEAESDPAILTPNADSGLLTPKLEDALSYQTALHDSESVHTMTSSIYDSELPLPSPETESDFLVNASEEESAFEETLPETKFDIVDNPIEYKFTIPKSPPEPIVANTEVSSEVRASVHKTSVEDASALHETPVKSILIQQETPAKDIVVQQETLSEAIVAQQETLAEAIVAQQETPAEAIVVQQETPAKSILVQQETSAEPAVGCHSQKSPSRPAATDLNIIKRKKTKEKSEPRPVLKTGQVNQNPQRAGIIQPLTDKDPPPHNLVNVILPYLKRELPHRWIVLPDDEGIHVMLLSQSAEKAIQRRAFFSYAGRESITVHCKPVPELIAQNILQDSVHNVVALTRLTKKAFFDRIITVIERFKMYEICIGANQPELMDLWKSEKDGEFDKNWYGELRYQETFRPTGCELLLPTTPLLEDRCRVCVERSSEMKAKFEAAEKFRHSQVASDEAQTAFLNSHIINLRKRLRKLHKELNHTRSQVTMLLKESDDMLSENNERNHIKNRPN